MQQLTNLQSSTDRASGSTLLELLLALVIVGGLLWGELRLERIQASTLRSLTSKITTVHADSPWDQLTSDNDRCAPRTTSSTALSLLICRVHHGFIVVAS